MANFPLSFDPFTRGDSDQHHHCGGQHGFLRLNMQLIIVSKQLMVLLFLYLGIFIYFYTKIACKQGMYTYHDKINSSLMQALPHLSFLHWVNTWLPSGIFTRGFLQRLRTVAVVQTSGTLSFKKSVKT